MDRVAIKNKAKEMIKGNKWYLWKPMVIVGLIAFAIAFVGGFVDALLGLMKEETKEIFGMKVTVTTSGPFTGVLSFLASFIEASFTVWYCKYLLDFTHGIKTEFKLSNFIEFFKKHWLICFVTSLLVGLNIAIGTILLIVPGIIRAISYFLVNYILADPDFDNLSPVETLDLSRKIMDGHKGEYFCMSLYYFVMMILGIFTLGILWIWTVPQMNLAYVKFATDLLDEYKKNNK